MAPREGGRQTEGRRRRRWEDRKTKKNNKGKEVKPQGSGCPLDLSEERK